MTIPLDPNLIVAEVAADLRCSKAHVHKLINGSVRHLPRLPSIRMGRRVIVRRSALERWKQQVEIESVDATLSASLNVDTVGAPRSKN